MACNCNISCNCDDLITPVGPQGPQGPDTIGPNGSNAVGEPGEPGDQGPKGPDATIYDSGWKELKDHNGVFGLAPVGGGPKPCIRIIRNKLYLSGSFLIPLSSDGGSTLYNNYPSYLVDNAGANFIQAYTGTDGGFNVVSKDYIISNTPIIPEDLCPDLESGHMLQYNGFVERGINPQGLPGTSITLTAPFGRIEITTEGKIVCKSIRSSTNGGDVLNSKYHKFIANMSAGETSGTYDKREITANPSEHVWKTSFPAVLATNSAIAGPTPSTYTYPSKFNGDDISKLGGFELNIQGEYPIDATKTQQQIIDAFNSI
jgi:hypothetical protein